MNDFLQDCMEDFRIKAKLKAVIPVPDFKNLFCAKCNQQCAHRQAGDPLALRAATQLQRLTQPTQADPNLPKYAVFSATEWTDMTMEALKLEIADRRGDWEVPNLDNAGQSATPVQTEVVERAVRQSVKTKRLDVPENRNENVWQRALALAGKKGGSVEYVQVIYGRLMSGQEETVDEAVEETSPLPEITPAPRHPKKNPEFRPVGRGNAEVQGGMIGGGSPPPPTGPDPWAAPIKDQQRVAAGAVIKFGADGVIELGEKK